MGAPVLNCVQIALHQAQVPQRPELLQLPLADATARGREILKDAFPGHTLIQLHQFAKFLAIGVVGNVGVARVRRRIGAYVPARGEAR